MNSLFTIPCLNLASFLVAAAIVCHSFFGIATLAEGPIARDFAQAVPRSVAARAEARPIREKTGTWKAAVPIPKPIAARVFRHAFRIALPISVACFLLSFGLWALQAVDNSAIRHLTHQPSGSVPGESEA